MGIKASDINEQSPWQEMTVGGEVYEGGNRPRDHHGRVAFQPAGLDRGEMQAVSAVCPLLPGLFHSGNRRKTAVNLTTTIVRAAASAGRYVPLKPLIL